MRVHIGLSLACVVAIASVSQACGLPRRTSTIAPPSRPIALHYDAALAAIGFPSPLLRLAIGGRTAWFIVDTGAGVHTIASWLVAAARLETWDSGAAVTGSTGTEQRVRTIHDLHGRLDDGRTLSLREG